MMQMKRRFDGFLVVCSVYFFSSLLIDGMVTTAQAASAPSWFSSSSIPSTTSSTSDITNVTTLSDTPPSILEEEADDDTAQQLKTLLQDAWQRRRRKNRGYYNLEEEDDEYNSVDEEENASSAFSFIAESVRVRGGEESALSSPADRFAESLVTAVGWLVAFQSLGTLLSSNDGQLANELASILLSRESVEAMKTIRNILSEFHEQHGVVDIFAKYRKQDILIAVFALNRLQHAALLHEQRSIHQTKQSITTKDNKALLDDLAHYAIYANAAYGWKMDLAVRWRINMGGNAQALSRQTGVDPDDIIVAKWESTTHRPAYFVVRDRNRKTIVLCVRGTWSAGDLLTDLCCTAQEFDHSSSPLPGNLTKTKKLSSTIYYKADGLFGRAAKRRRCGHHGMLEAARALQRDSEDLLEKDLQANPDYSLVLVGHSMGGGVVALLSTLLERKFPNLRVYTYGPSCVSPDTAKLHKNIVSVVIEGDPFCRLSLGHVADVSAGLASICEDPMLRNDILMRTNAPVDEMEDDDLKWCYETMEILRENMNADKLYPPGRILLLSGESLSRPLRQFKPNGRHGLNLREVSPLYFRDLVISPKMLDLSRHIPSLYESALRALADS